MLPRYAIEMDYNAYPNAHAIFLTCWKFVNWLRQLAEEVQCYVCLHIDGQYKLHYGRWVFVALGIHCLKYDPKVARHTHSFRPLVLAMTKEEESIEVTRMHKDVRLVVS